MYKPVNYLKIGYFGRTFGKHGDVRLILTHDIDIIEDKIKHLYIWTEGQYLPFFIKKVTDEEQLLVQFEDLLGSVEANTLTNHEAFVSDMQIDFDDHAAIKAMGNELEGYTVVDSTTGTLLTVKEVEEYPLQTMLVCTKIGREETILVPFVQEWLEGVKPKTKTINMALPEGLLD